MDIFILALKTVGFTILGLACFILVFYIVSWTVLGLVSLTINTKKYYKKPSWFYRHLLNYGYRVICSHGRVRIHCTGLDMLPKDQRFMFVSNHRSNFDNMIHSVSMHWEPLAFISKKENFKIPIGHRYITRGCYIAIDRGNPRSGLESILRATELIQSGACSVGVFPEGTRSKDCSLLEFKPGCFKIAQKAKCPIVVGVTRGTENIHRNLPWKKTNVYFDIIDVIKPEQFAGKTTVEMAELVENKIRNFIKEK